MVQPEFLCLVNDICHCPVPQLEVLDVSSTNSGSPMIQKMSNSSDVLSIESPSRLSLNLDV